MRPAFLDEMSWAMAEVYESVTDRILVNMAKYFPYRYDPESVAGAQRLGAFEYQARMLAQMGKVSRETADIIANSLTGADAQLRESLDKAIVEALRTEEPKLRKAAEKGLLYGEGAVQPQLSPNQMNAFRTYYRQSADKLNLVNTVMLESTQAAYTATVSDVVNRIERTQSILNTATGEVVTGVSAWNQAMRGAVDRMISNGLTGFIDHGGHHWSPEAYVAMDIRTTMFNTARAAIWELNESYGNDLYQVSSHNGARPLCYPWQGKVISRSDAVREVEDLDGNRIHVYAQSETSYGEAAGLFGVNCKHYPMTFIPGVSTIKGEPQDPEENEKTYELSQQQRGLERKLREEKLQLNALKAQGAPESEIRGQQAKVAQASDDIRVFCDETGRTRRRSREAVLTNASFEGAKTPPYGVPFSSVSNEYRAKARPGRGEIIPELGYKTNKHPVEQAIANDLVQSYGGDIVLRKEDGRPGVYTPDYTWNGRDWEQKTVSTAKAANEATRHGLKQIMNNPGGLIITKSNPDIDDAALLTEIAKRVNQGPVQHVDVIITESGKPMRAYRMGNKN